jgi:DNA-binding MurR/RpiR family transcriptional regulator
MTDHANEIGDMGIRDIAQNTFVSTATISRLCKKLGFTGFSEFVYHLRSNHANRIRVQEEAVLGGSIRSAYAHFTDHYEHTSRLLREEDVGSFLELLAGKPAVFLYGAGFSALYAEYLSKKLQVLGFTATHSNLGDSKALFLNNIKRHQLFIAFSRSGETAHVVEKARIAKSLGIDIVSFTNSKANTLADLADITFAVYDETGGEREIYEVTPYESNLLLLIDMLLYMRRSK